jgi:hypothetical protein
MALCREYFPSDTIKLINQSEGRMVRNNKITTPAMAGEPGDRAAHSIGRHLLAGSPGGLGLGIGQDDFANRFLSNPLDDEGRARASSVWIGKGEMAILLCELLNSDCGQIGLKALDQGAKRVFVHYINLGKLSNLYSRFGALKFNESTIAITPSSEILEDKTFHNPKTGVDIIKKVKRRIPEVRKSNVTAKEIGAINAVIDRFSSGLHVQTLYPSGDAVASYAGWSIGGVEITAWADTKGKVQQKLSPRRP